jgi:nucleoside-diphosphate-sugar epimerase
MTTKCALMTGATGYIGGRLAERLVSQGIRVVAVVRAGSDCRIAGVQAVEYRANPTAIAKVISQFVPDVFFHLAAHADVDKSSVDKTATLMTNVMFSATVLEAAVIAGCRILVNAGTQSQHRDGTAKYVPTSFYAASKQAFQDVVRYYEIYEGLRTLTLKLSDIYGPMDPRGRVVDLLLNAQLNQTKIDLSPGYQHIDLLHVDDAVAAFEVAGEALADNETMASEYCVASGRHITLRQLARLLERLNNAPIDAQWGARPYGRGAIMRPWKGPILPGWRAAILLEDGLSAMMAERRRSEVAVG